MEFLSEFLPIVIYFLLIALIIVFTVLGIKLITTMNKVDKIVDEVNEKISALDGIFNVMNYASNSINAIFDTIVSFFTDKVKKLMSKKRKEEDYE